MTLALIAGSGALPVQIAGAYPTAQIYALDGTETPLDADRFRVETLGTLLATLKTRTVTEVCFAGAVARRQIDPTQIDAATLPLVPQLMAAAQTRGDDATLRAVLDLFQMQGFAIRAAHDLLPDLLPPPGVLAGDLTDQIKDNAARAADVLRLIAPADLGQSCVVRAGQVVAVETQPGTDWMLHSLSPDRSLTLGDAAAMALQTDRPAVFYKAPKQGQDRRIDLPTIGPSTIARAQAAGIAAVVIEADGVIMLDQQACIDAAAAAGLTLWVRPCASL